MIQKLREKIKHLPPRVWGDLFVAISILLVGLIAFGLGRLSVLYSEKPEVEIIYPSQGKQAGGEVLGAVSYGFVASKNGSSYHLPWCAGAQTIREENKVFFDTKEQAEQAGYRPAGNCKGL